MLDSGKEIRAVLIFSSTFLVTYIFVHTWRRNADRKRRNLPPSIPSLPIVGSRPFVSKKLQGHEFFLQKSYEMGDVIGFRSGNIFEAVVLNSYDVIKEALVKQSADFASRPTYYFNTFLNPQAKGIIESSYDVSFRKYHQLSLAILKEFGFGQNVMESRINLEVEDLISRLKGLKNEPVNPKPLVASSVLNVITSIAIGDRLSDAQFSDKMASSVDVYFKHTRYMFLLEYMHAFRFIPFFATKLKEMIDGKDFLLNFIDSKISEYLNHKKSESKLDSGSQDQVEPDQKSERNGINQHNEHGVMQSFISSFIEREGDNIFDREQLKYTVRDFLLAGYETSATTLQWLLIALVNNPDVQERMQAELDDVVPNHRLPALEDKDKLPYVDAVILEVMRHRTLLPLSLPRWTVKDTTVGGFLIPKNTMVLSNLYAAHMNKKSWDNPESFNPDRFLNATRTKVINREKVIPFSLGKRSCLGELLARQEIYLFATGLLQNFTLKPPEGVEKVEVKVKTFLNLTPSPFNIRFIPRKLSNS